LNSYSKYELFLAGILQFKPKLHWARHVTSRHDSTRSTCPVVSSCACSNMTDNEQAIVLACTSLFRRLYFLHTQILFVPSNEINVYSNKLLNNLH